MGFIGVQPTSVPLTSSDITDGIISTAKIADDAVGNTKLDLTANYAFTGTVTGAGDTSDFVKIYQSTWTSGTAEIGMPNIISATYDHYKIVGSVEVNTSSICRLYMTSGGASPVNATNTAVYMGEGGNRASNTTYLGATSNGASGYMTFPNNNNILVNCICSFQIELHDMFTGVVNGEGSPARVRHFSFNCSEKNANASDYHQHWGGGHFRNNDSSHMPQVTGLILTPSSGNFTEGNVSVYGYKK